MFNFLGNAINKTFSFLGDGLRKGYDSIADKAKHINHTVGKVARGVHSFASQFEFLKPVADIAGKVGDMSDLVGDGIDVSDKVVNSIERISRNVKEGKMDAVRNDYGEMRQGINQFAHRVRSHR